MTFRKRLMIVALLGLISWMGIWAVTQINLPTQVQGLLPVANLTPQVFFQNLTNNLNAAITGVVTTNAGKFNSVYIPYPLTFSNIQWSIVATDNTSNVYDFGGFGPGCLGGTASIPLAFHIGATAGTTFAPSAGRHSAAASGAPVTIMPGYYCVGITSSAASPLATLGGDNTGTYQAPFATNAVIASVSTSGAFNSTITAPATSFGLTKEVYLALY